jgi:hypothetical protein
MPAAPAGKDVIYIGVDKQQAIATGVRGRFIVDDARRYPVRKLQSQRQGCVLWFKDSLARDLHVLHVHTPG